MDMPDRVRHDVLEPRVAEGVVTVRFFPCEAEADQGHDARRGIGEVVESVSGNGDGMRENAREQFPRK